MPPRCACAKTISSSTDSAPARPATRGRAGKGRWSVLADRSGAAAVEFAIAAPVLMTIIYGSVEVGRLLYADHAIGHAARESSRFAMVRSAESGNPATDAQIEAVAQRATVLDPDRVTVVTVYDPDAMRGSTVQVQVTYSYTPMFPYLAPEAITLKARSTKLIVN